MTTKISNTERATQTIKASPNLGGPTSNILATREIEINRAWVDRYEQLNGNGGA